MRESCCMQAIYRNWTCPVPRAMPCTRMRPHEGLKAGSGGLACLDRDARRDTLGTQGALGRTVSWHGDKAHPPCCWLLGSVESRTPAISSATAGLSKSGTLIDVMAANAGLEPLTFGRVLEVAQDRGTFPRGRLPDYDWVLTHKSQRSSYGPLKTPKWTDLEEKSKEEIQSPRSEQLPTAGFNCTWTRADSSTMRMNRSLRTRHTECTRKLFLRGR